MSNLKYKHTAYTSAQWASLNPVIVENEIVIESDTKRTKIGNGISTYNELEYADANSVGNSLGSIKPTDPAPTPARNGNYTFSIGGAKPAWLTAEPLVTEVKAGDGVAVVYSAPSSYAYTHVDMNSQTLQKTAQTLTTEEQLQVRKNIGVESTQIKLATTKQSNLFSDHINLFDKSTALTNSGLDANGLVVAYNNRYCSQFVRVLGSTLMQISEYEKCAQYDKDLNLISIDSTSRNLYEFTTASNCEYLRIQGYYTTLESNMILLSKNKKVGNTYQAYNSKNIYGSETSVFKPDMGDPDLLYFVDEGKVKTSKSKNLFDKRTAIINTILVGNGLVSTISGWYTSVMIPVNSDVDVVCNNCERYEEYDVSKKPISGTYFDGNSETYTKKTSSTTKFIRVTVYSSFINALQLEYGTVPTTYTPFTCIVSSTPLEPNVTFKPDLTDSDLLTLIKSKLFGKNYLAIGDSLTAANNYQNKVASSLGMNVITHALGGIGIIAMVDGTTGISALTPSDLANVQLVTFLGGYNDRGTPDGVVTDLYPAQNTLAGRYNYAFNKLFSLANEAGNTDIRIVAIAPHKVGKYSYIDADGDDEWPIGSGRSLLTQVNVLEQVCIRKSIPLINLYKLSGINEFTWNIFSATNTATNAYTYIGEFATVENLPAGTLNQAARVVSVANAYIHNGTTWVYGTTPYPWNTDQLHCSNAGYTRFAEVIAAQLKSLI